MVLEHCGRICHDRRWAGSTQAPLVDPLMDRSSKAITLALIGSAFLLGGCSDPEIEEEEQNGQATAGQQHHGGGVFIAPRIGGFGGGAGGGVATSPSARGGFGSTGSASAST
jgi:hypothetical protein